MKKIALLIVLFNLLIFAPAQERISESVEVNWWVIPLFAVDGKGDSVMNLKEEDIKLFLDGKEVKNFILYRKQFSVTEVGVQKETIKEDPLKDKEKMIFFLFDTTLSSKDAIEKSRKIAANIVENADTENRFVVMSISPHSGLTYSGGPTNDKKLIQKLMEKRVSVRGRINDSVVRYVLDSSPGKYETNIISSLDEVRSFLIPSFNRHLKKKNLNFLSSFETLFYAVNTIKSNKFIYLFSDGIKKSTQVGESQSYYQLYLKKVADYLGQSGAVLFIINPSGTETSAFSDASGEESLRFLAKESGGKYLEGVEEKIAERIENIHRAYYEIGFSDLPESRGNARRVTIKSNRGGITFHTQRSLKEHNNYAVMQGMEKEMLAFNLIKKNPLFKLSFPFQDITVDRIEKTQQKTVFHVTLPDEFLEHSCDLFKILIDKNSREPKIERNEVKSMNNKMAIRFENIEGKENQFVLIDGTTNLALVGRFDYLADGTIAGYKTMSDGSLGLTAIILKEVEFKTKTLHLIIEDFLLRNTAQGPVGLVDIRVSIQNLQGIELFDEKKVLQPQKESVTIDLPFPWLKKGRYKIVVEVRDRLTGKNDKKSVRPHQDTL